MVERGESTVETFKFGLFWQGGGAGADAASVTVTPLLLYNTIAANANAPGRVVVPRSSFDTCQCAGALKTGKI